MYRRVRQSEIADIRRVRFPEVSFNDTDKLVYVFKVGWRFGLFFDFTAGGLDSTRPPAYVTPLDIDQVEVQIGNLYRYLSFYSVYRLLETETKQFDQMQNDGWFPFVETIPVEFDALARAYTNKFNFDDTVSRIIERFDQKRIHEISERWWRNDRFAGKRELIEAGVNAYPQNTPDGFVTCIKTLLSEVEGLLRSIYHTDTGQGQTTEEKFLEHIAEKARSAAGSDDSLLLPGTFIQYLKAQVFGDFDVDKGIVPLSRHSSGHGVASPDLYTKARALQVILVLDQIHFYD